MAPTNPNQIDISLSLLPGESQTVITSLITELRAVSQQLQAIQLGDPAAQAAAMRPTAQVGEVPQSRSGAESHPRGARQTVEDAGIPGGTEQRQQHEQRRDTQRDQRQQERTAEQEAQRQRQRERQEEFMHAVRDRQLEMEARQKLAQGGLRSTLGVARASDPAAYAASRPDLALGTPDNPVPEETARQTYQQVFEGTTRATRAMMATDSGQRTMSSEQILQTAIDQERQSWASRGRTVPDLEGVIPQNVGEPPRPMAPWQQKLDRAGVNRPMEALRFGQFTPQDTFFQMSKMMGMWANRAQRHTNTPNAGQTRGNIAAGLAGMGMTVPFFQNYGRTNLGQQVRPADMEELGMRSGADQGTSYSVGPIGFRSPYEWLRAQATGYETAGRFAVAGATSPYLKAHEAMASGRRLVGAGMGPREAENAIRDVHASLRADIIKTIPLEEIDDIIVQASRSGGQSLQELARTINMIPGAAYAANTSFEETLATMKEMGEMNQSQGGDYLSGMRGAAAAQQSFGLPAQMLAQFQNNDLAQGMMFGQTGVMPGLQGVIDPVTRMEMGLESFDMVRNMIPTQNLPQAYTEGGRPINVDEEQYRTAMTLQAMGLDPQMAEKYEEWRQTQRESMNIGQTAQELEAYANMGFTGPVDDITARLSQIDSKGAKELEGLSGAKYYEEAERLIGEARQKAEEKAAKDAPFGESPGEMQQRVVIEMQPGMERYFRARDLSQVERSAERAGRQLGEVFSWLSGPPNTASQRP